jgi:hypothetical protein
LCRTPIGFREACSGFVFARDVVFTFPFGDAGNIVHHTSVWDVLALFSFPGLHFGQSLTFLQTCRSRLVGIGAAIYVRFELRYHCWPWLLLRACVLPDEEKAELFRKFLQAPTCCLDDAWGLPLRSRIRSSEDMQSPDFQVMLLNIARKVKVTNMSLEGELSKIRSAVPVAKRSSNSERLCYLSHLGFLMQDHLACGNRGSRGQESRADLLVGGVPLESRPAQLYTRPVGISFMVVPLTLL